MTMPEKTVKVPLADREVEMRAPSDGAMVVMARAFRGLPKIENVAEMSEGDRDKLIRNLGILGQVVDGMIVKDDDKDWLDDVMITGSVTAEDLFAAIRVAGEKMNGTAVANKPQPPVRRRRG